MISAAEPLTATNEEYIDMLVVLDNDAAQTASDELAKVRRSYELEVRKRGREIVWFPHIEAFPMPRVGANQLLLTLPGVEVFELRQRISA